MKKNLFFLFTLLLVFAAGCGKPSASTLMHRAIFDNDLHAVNNLLAKGVDINAKNEKGDTALHLAAWNGQVEIIQLLLDSGVDINEINNIGETALSVAVLKCDSEIVKMLLNTGADPLVATRFPIYINAVFGNNLDMLDIFLAIGKGDVNAQDENHGWTPLWLAARFGNTEMVKRLLAAGANNANIRANNGIYALMWGAFHKNSEIIKILISAGAEVNVKDNEKNTTLMCAAYFPPPKDAPPDTIETAPSQESIDRAAEVIRLLLAAGADLHAVNEDGKTALDIAREHNAVDLIPLLTPGVLE